MRPKITLIFGAIFFSLILCELVLAQDDADTAEEQEEEDPDLVEVETRSGPVIGRRAFGQNLDGEETEHYRFLGIPYAEPPVGSLRFQEPIHKKPWIDAIDAQDFGPVCPQLEGENIVGDEDCLTLNVFTPRVPTRDIAKQAKTLTRSFLLPIMIWLHSSVMDRGNSMIDPSPILEKDVVVVSLNFRLGALGFLNLDHPQVAGNMAFKDQLEAILWIKENAQYFGGDPNKITLAGSNDGGVMAHLHQLSPLGDGLYNGIIAQSGNALQGATEFLKTDKVQRDSHRFVEKLGCNQDPGVLECLQEKDLEDLIVKPDTSNDGEMTEIERELRGEGNYAFVVSVDRASQNPFLPENPYKMLLKGSQKDLPIITGVAVQDGSVWLDFENEEALVRKMNSNFSYYGPNYILLQPFEDITAQTMLVANVTKRFYIGKGDIDVIQRNDLIEMFTDSLWRATAIKAMKLQSRTQTSPVFYYEMIGDASLNPDTRSAGGSSVTGTNTLIYLFDSLVNVFRDLDLSSEGLRETRESVLSMWTNFVKFKDPTPFEDRLIPQWEPYHESTEEQFMEIGPEPEIKKRSKRDAIFFWQEIYYDEQDKYFGKRSHGIPSSNHIKPTTQIQQVPYPYGFGPQPVPQPPFTIPGVAKPGAPLNPVYHFKQ